VDYNRAFQNIDGSILMSTQSSSIIITTMTETGLEETGHKQAVHCLLGQPMPIWTVAIDKRYDTNKFISGGDDCAMRLWDLRADSCVGANSRQHTAGVTAAQWHPVHEHMFLTGSYDETCCIWDMRNIKSPLHVVQTGE
jgi:WD40 repeat protein